MKKSYQTFFQTAFLLLLIFGLVNGLGQALCFSSHQEDARMSNSTFYDRLKKESKFEAWGGKTRDLSTRFHHLLSPPDGPFGNWHIATASHRSKTEFALGGQYWNISKVKGGDVFSTIYIWEYPSINATHEALIRDLMSISASGFNFSPVPNSPGDVLILDEMARDNVTIRPDIVHSADAGTRMALLRQIDEWLLGNWPLMASKEKSGGTPSLKVGIRAKSQSVRVGEPLELVVEVRKNDTVLDLKTLPHRFLVDPGRISWKNNSYMFTSDRRGMSEITLDVVGPEGEYGQGTLKMQVTAK